MKTSRQLILPFCLLLILFCGCGPKTTPVTGKVTFSGQTGENIRVLFLPIAQGHVMPESAIGMTDSQGQFALRLSETKKRGAIPGEYSVFISWVDPNFDPNIVAEGAREGKCPYKIPAKAKLGQIIFTVPETGPCEANFEFTDKDFDEKIKMDR